MVKQLLATTRNMIDQLNRLVELSRLPQISLGIISSRTTPLVMPPESFWLYDTDQVRVDTIPGQIRIKAPTDVGLYEKAFARLAKSAVVGDAARDIISQAVREFEAT